MVASHHFSIFFREKYKINCLSTVCCGVVNAVPSCWRRLLDQFYNGGDITPLETIHNTVKLSRFIYRRLVSQVGTELKSIVEWNVNFE